jgi:hypothetical protein
VTLLGLACVLGLGRLPLPGIDREALGRLSESTAEDVTAGALGMAPFITGFLLVELAVLAWVLVRRRPEPDRASRRWMLAAAFGLALAFGLVQAHSIATFFSTVGVLASYPTVVLTLAAVTMATGLVLLAVSRYGMANGFSLAILASVLVQARGRVRELVAPAAGWADETASTPLLVLVGLGLVAACAFLIRAREGRSRVVSVPLLPAGGVPLVVAGFVPPLLSMTGVSEGWAVMAMQASVMLLGAVVLSWLFRAPARVSMAVPGTDGADLTRRLLVMGAGSGLVLFTLHLAAGMAERTPGFFLGIAVADLLVAVAACLDLADRLAFRWRHGLRHVVELTTLHTVFEADAVAGRLAAASIDHHVQGHRHRSIQYVLAAYVEMRVLVTEADLVRARVALRHEGEGRT